MSENKSRADNLKLQDPSTLEERKAAAVALLEEGTLTYKQIISRLREKYGIGIGFAFLSKEKARMRRVAKRAEGAAKRAATKRPAPQQLQLANPNDGLVGVVSSLCRSGLRCVLRADGSIEVVA